MHSVYLEENFRFNNILFNGRITITPIKNENSNNTKVVCTYLDLSKIKEYEHELILKNQELKLINYSLSHDLKSPLVTLSSFSNILIEDLDEGNNEAVKEDLKFITQASESIGNLIQSMLNYSRLGRILQDMEEIPLEEIISSAKSNLNDNFAKINYSIEIYADNFNLKCKRYQAIQLFQNLLENSFKFRNKEKELKIEIGNIVLDDKNFVYYRDNGIGMSKEFLDKAFNLYEQFNKDIEGTGMGLAIVKKIVDLHGGEIRVESEGKNKGVTFYFTLSGKHQT